MSRQPTEIVLPTLLPKNGPPLEVLAYIGRALDPDASLLLDVTRPAKLSLLRHEQASLDGQLLVLRQRERQLVAEIDFLHALKRLAEESV